MGKRSADNMAETVERRPGNQKIGRERQKEKTLRETRTSLHRSRLEWVPKFLEGEVQSEKALIRNRILLVRQQIRSPRRGSAACVMKANRDLPRGLRHLDDISPCIGATLRTLVHLHSGEGSGPEEADRRNLLVS